MGAKRRYAEKLLDPRWQRKRLEVFERDGWACTHCGAKDVTLNVHHESYQGANPWDTPSEQLATVCVVCHEKEHGIENARHSSRPKLKSTDDILVAIGIISAYPYMAIPLALPDRFEDTRNWMLFRSLVDICKVEGIYATPELLQRTDIIGETQRVASAMVSMLDLGLDERQALIQLNEIMGRIWHKAASITDRELAKKSEAITGSEKERLRQLKAVRAMVFRDGHA